MAIARDIFGYRYEDSEPAFVDAGSTFWFHRPTSRLLTKVSVAAYMASFTPAMTMAAKEAGTPSAAFLAEHTGIPIPAAPGGGGGGGGGTTITAAAAGSPGSFTGGTPANLAALKALGPLGNTTAWKDRAIGTLQQYVALGDASNASWGGAAWNAVTAAQVKLDITDLITGGASGWPGAAAPVNLAALKADAQAGNGKGYQADGTFGTGVAFATGQFVILGDASKAHYSGTVWVAGAAP